MVAADARTAVVFALSPGNAHDAPEGRALLEDLGPMPEGLPMLMDKAYEGNESVRASNAMVGGSGWPRIGYFAIFAA